MSDTRSSFKLAQIKLAIDKQKNGYQLIKNSLVIDFWNKYVEYKNIYFPNLDLVIISDIKPTNGVWTHFRTTDSKLCICYKSNKGYVDLTFNGQGDKIEQIKALLVKAEGDYYDKGLSVVKTGKSCAIRINVPIVDFCVLFEAQVLYIQKSFEAVARLSGLANSLDLLGVHSI